MSLSPENQALFERVALTYTPGPHRREVRMPETTLNRLLDAARAAGSGVAISTDGPHPPSEQRRWLARQLLDSRLDDAEAFGVVAGHPDITP